MSFIVSVLFVLIGAQQPGEGKLILNPPMPEPLCDCSSDLFDCSDFATQFDAQQCLDSCWVVMGEDVHFLDADSDFGFEALPYEWLPMERKLVCERLPLKQS